jgi:tetracycline 7-halogenase / FADH2 O2-dependent halogenase
VQHKDLADVAVVGTGMVGSVLALALARNGARVELFDTGVHPRFALGESTIPAASIWLKLLAERWGVPEFHDVASASAINTRVAATSGVKKNFSFVLHEPGATSHRRAWLHPIPGSQIPTTGETHLYRQDVDAYLHHLAIAEGCVSHAPVQLAGVDVDATGVTLTANDGRTFRARCVIDASGPRSLVATRLGMRETPTRLRTHSRTLYTHMIGVRPFDDVYRGPRPVSKFHEGTLHHIFDGGWIWVIPFDNHPGSKNRLCSVGLSLDSRRFPRQPDPQAEWDAMIARFPLIAAHFRGARTVRPWISTDRQQYSSHASVADRVIVTTAAAGAVDALYSRGLANSFQALDPTIRLVLEAIVDDDFSAARFAPIDQLQRNLLEIHDGLVAGAFAAFRDAELLDLWLAIWDLSGVLQLHDVLEALRAYADSSDRGALAFNDADPAHCMTEYAVFRDVLDRCSTIMATLAANEIDVVEARSRIVRVLDEVNETLSIDHVRRRRAMGAEVFSSREARRARLLRAAYRVLALRPRGLWKLGLEIYDVDRRRSLSAWSQRLARFADKLRRTTDDDAPHWLLATRYCVDPDRPLVLQRESRACELTFTPRASTDAVRMRLDGNLEPLCRWIAGRRGEFDVASAWRASAGLGPVDTLLVLDELVKVGALQHQLG